MDIEEELANVQRRISAGSDFGELCLEYNAPSVSGAWRLISSVDTAAYGEAIRTAAERAERMAQPEATKALYFEYSMDDGWRSGLFLCPEYRPRSALDDDWAADFTVDLPSGDLPAFSEIYASTERFCRDDESTRITLLLAIVTASIVSSEFSGFPEGPAICLGFHGQDLVWRLREPQA